MSNTAKRVGSASRKFAEIPQYASVNYGSCFERHASTHLLAGGAWALQLSAAILPIWGKKAPGFLGVLPSWKGYFTLRL